MKSMKQRMKRVFSIALAAVLLAVLSVPASLPVYGKDIPISVYGNGAEVYDTDPSVENNTIFTNEAQFTIMNNYEDRVVTVSSITISGDDASDFIIAKDAASELSEKGKSGDTTTFVVQCNAAGDELRDAEVTINISYDGSDGPVEGSISFPIKGGMYSGGGTGTQTDPFLISTAGDLKQLSELVNAGTSYGGIYFEMTDNIRLNGDASDYEDWGTTPPAVTWAAIGTEDDPFSGVFNGGKHEVSGIYSVDDDVDYNGMFGYGQGCTIENLGVVNSMIAGDYAGAIAGGIEDSENSPALVRNCWNKGIVSGNEYVGGIVGGANTDTGCGTIIDSCINSGTVSLSLHKGSDGSWDGGGSIGGIAGMVVKSLILNCGSTGRINVEAEYANDTYAGGIVGAALSGLKCVLNNYSSSYIKVTYTTGNAVCVGGISGYISDEDVTNNYYAGTIESDITDVPVENIGYAFGYVDAPGSVIGRNYYDISQVAIGEGGEEGMAEGISEASMKLGSGDDALVTKLNDGITSVSAIITEKGYTGVTPSAWYISSNLNSGYPQFTAPSSGDSGHHHNTTPVVSGQVLINNNPVNAGTYSTGTENGRSVTAVTLDETALNERLQTEGNSPTVTIPVGTDSDIIRGELNGQMVKNMEESQAILQIKTDSVQYTLPAQQIDIDAISSEVGKEVALSDIKVQIQISKSSQDTVKVIENAAEKGSFTLVAPPVEFEITCTYGDKTVSVSQFNNYVERTVAIPDGVDPAKITTGVVLDPDGTVHHVPTKIVLIDGKYYAKINSLTNSVYSVVWNPVEFSDTANHWAKAAINDMGSRMVIGGIGNGNFEPDRDVTRAEFAAIIVRALGLPAGEGENTFKDVGGDAWYAGYVETAVSYGIISGLDKSTFAPDSKITREQAMTMTARAMKLTGLDPGTSAEIAGQLADFIDSGSISNYAKQGIEECLKTGVVSGRGAGTIAPKENMTRAEVAVIVQRLLQKSNLI